MRQPQKNSATSSFIATELNRHRRRPVADSVSFVIPCFNERPEVVLQTVETIRGAFSGVNGIQLEFIVVNDGSTAFQYEEVAETANCQVIDLPRNRGYGAALKVGISHAEHDWVGIVDADGTYPVEEFPAMLELTAEYDMVVGARDWGDIATTRRHTKMLITRIASWFADFPIPDLNSGMRFFHRSLVEPRWRLYPNRFSFSTTLTMFGISNNRPVVFYPIRYGKRLGKSKINPVKDTVRFVTQLFRLAMYFRPLRFFLPLSGIFLTLGVIRGVRDMLINNYLGGLSLILFFMAFQIFFFGLIAEVVNKKSGN